jgi:demethylmenaquinone methyltransferase/2-methoxy-6-polyprenyl-1,4-benzoquinol methylase
VARDATPRLAPGPLATAHQYDVGADGFDARFAASRATIRRFDVIDGPQRRCACGAERVLEIGCGTGRLLATLGGRLCVGIDVSEGLLRIATSKDLAVLRADAHRLPFAEGSFDAITAGNGVFRYLDYDRAFAECARVLRRGGRLAVHQYSRWPLGLRMRRLAADNPLEVGDLAEVRRPAGEVGFVEEEVYLWRTLSFWPYAMRLPELVAWRLWDHVTFVFRKA